MFVWIVCVNFDMVDEQRDRGMKKGGREEDGDGERKEGRVGGRKDVCYKTYLLFIATLQLTDAELPHWVAVAELAECVFFFLLSHFINS